MQYSILRMFLPVQHAHAPLYSGKEGQVALLSQLTTCCMLQGCNSGSYAVHQYTSVSAHLGSSDNLKSQDAGAYCFDLAALHHRWHRLHQIRQRSERLSGQAFLG